MRLSSTICLLALGVASAQNHANPIAEWDKLATHAITAHKINSNVSQHYPRHASRHTY